MFFTPSRIPTISICSPAFSTPRSTRPVATVPRPVIVIVSSTGIRNGLSVSRVGVGMKASTAAISFSTAGSPISLWSPSRALTADAHDDRAVVAGELVLGEKLPHLQLHQLDQLRVVHLVGLVQEDDDGGHADLAGQQDVLAGLGHGAVGGGDHEDGPVHLGGAGDHVLDVVGVSGAVDVGVVARAGLVLDVGGVDGDAALALLGGGVDGGVGAGLCAAALGQHAGDGRRQAGLAVVHVADRADVDVRLRAVKLRFSHD